MRTDHPLGWLLFLVGPPGCGKTTLAETLERRIPSTAVLHAGDCWRRIAAGSGRFAAAVGTAVERQEPIPERVFILAHRLFFRRRASARQIVVDGTPYSVEQIRCILEAYRSRRRAPPRTVLVTLDADDEECGRRLRARNRPGDTEAAIGRRLELYRRRQKPAIDEAVRLGLLPSPIEPKPGSDLVATIRYATGS